MENLVDLERYPLDRPESESYAELLRQSRAELDRNGLFNLSGFLRPEAVRLAVSEVAPVLERDSFRHARRHNIYFRESVPGLAADHPALRMFETVNHTICADQMAGMVVRRLYEWAPLARFLAAAMGMPALFVMDDPLAGVNTMAYRAGEALNWHFDGAEFTTTLLLQAPSQGGEFEYRTDLRDDENPNHEGVARLLDGNDPQVRRLRLTPGTLNVFRGRNTPHRVTPVTGADARIISVFSYFDRPGVAFTGEERVGFYGRAG